MLESAETLRRSLTELIEESQALRMDVKRAERQRRKENQINLGLTGILVIFVLIVLGVAWQNNQITHNTAETNRQIADCTTAGGTCYNEGRARTSAAIGDLIKATVYMSECARLYPGESGPAFDAKLEQCVADKLEAARKAGS